eukprot:98627-Rhodomonas_salina.2
MQCPVSYASSKVEKEWSRHIESMRKDVECTFGMLKGLFRILKVPCRYENKECVDNVWWTCCILHNWLLSYDGLYRMEHGMQWAGADGLLDSAADDMEEQEMRIWLGAQLAKRARIRQRCTARTTMERIMDCSGLGADCLPFHVIDTSPEYEEGWTQLRHLLVVHYQRMKQHRAVVM